MQKMYSDYEECAKCLTSQIFWAKTTLSIWEGLKGVETLGLEILGLRISVSSGARSE